MNDPPTITPPKMEAVVEENVTVGYTIFNFSLSDPDTGEWGEMDVNSTDMPEELDMFRATSDLVQIKTKKLLDADKYKHHNLTMNTDDLFIMKSIQGPVLYFNIKVRDKPGLISNSSVRLTIKDIGDEEPTCNKQNIIIQTTKNETGVIANVDRNCVGRNYNSQTVSYTLIQKNCSEFAVGTSGEVIVKERISNDKMSCFLIIQAADDSFPNCTVNFNVSIEFLECPGDIDYMNNEWKNGTQGKFTFISCPTGYNGTVKRYCNENGRYQEPVYNCTQSAIADPSVLECPGDIDYMNNEWKNGTQGKFTFISCPTGYDGTVKRYCNETGVYQEPVYNCTRSAITDIYNEIEQQGDSVNITTVLDKLANATSVSDSNDTLLIGDIKTIDAMLSKTTDLITNNTANTDHLTDSFMETANNILEEKTAETWKVMINQTGSGADSVLHKIDNFVEKIVTLKKTAIVLPKSNLYLKTGSAQTCEENIRFPNRDTDIVSEWANRTKDQLVIGCGNGTFQFYSGVLYRNLSKIIPSTASGSRSDKQLNAPVISFSTFLPSTKRHLDTPVKIKFHLYHRHWKNARCSFWANSKSTSQGYWSEEDCEQKLDESEQDTVVCVCKHLTNFAVLMSPVSSLKKNDDHNTALSIISLVGCIISMVCLLLTIAAFVKFWRVVRGVRSIIHISLSCSLILAYILFLSGINRTENRDVCKAMAVLLHLVFLIVFFNMLTEGCNLAYSVIKPLSTRKPGLPLLIASYVLAVVIVAVSMGVTQLEGYGEEQTCWLSTETGLIWAFLVPVFVVIGINIIIVALVLRVMCKTVSMARKSSMGRTKAALRSILIIMPLMGLTWMFGSFAVSEETRLFQYLFAICNSLQGLLIFIFHCLMNKKIRDALRVQIQKSKLTLTQSSGLSETQKMKTQDTTDL